MDSNTHIAVGVAAAFMIMQPSVEVKELVLGSTLAVIGSLISDIDIHNSKANKAIDKIIWIIGITGVTSLIIDYFFNLGIYTGILNNIAIMKVIVSISLFSIVIMFAKTTSHRSFSHSLIGIVAFCVPVSLIFNNMSKYFLIGIISHIIIDLFNKKRVQIFYPIKKGICFKLCGANGYVNKALLFISMLYIMQASLKYIYKF